MAPHISPLFLTVTECASKLGRSRLSIYRLLKRGLLPRDPNSRHVAIPEWSVTSYVEQAGNLQPFWWKNTGKASNRNQGSARAHVVQLIRTEPK